LKLERKASAFIAWSVEREVSLHVYFYTFRRITHLCSLLFRQPDGVNSVVRRVYLQWRS